MAAIFALKRPEEEEVMLAAVKVKGKGEAPLMQMVT